MQSWTRIVRGVGRGAGCDSACGGERSRWSREGPVSSDLAGEVSVRIRLGLGSSCSCTKSASVVESPTSPTSLFRWTVEYSGVAEVDAAIEDVPRRAVDCVLKDCSLVKSCRRANDCSAIEPLRATSSSSVCFPSSKASWKLLFLTLGAVPIRDTASAFLASSAWA